MSKELRYVPLNCAGFDITALSTERHSNLHFFAPLDKLMMLIIPGSTVENALKALPGVITATASFAQSYATVTARLSFYNSSLENLQEEAIDAVDCVGFDAAILSQDELHQYIEHQKDSQSSSSSVTSEETFVDDILLTDLSTALFHIGGMSCAVCVGRVERLLKEVEGVGSVSVMLTTHRAQIKVDSNTLEAVADACCKAVILGGYDCTILQLGQNSNVTLAQNAAQLEESRQGELQTWRRLLMISTALTLPLYTLSHYQVVALMKGTPSLQEWILLALATPVQFGVGSRYYRAAYKGWTNGRFLGMDFLVIMGTTASYLYSILVFGTQLTGGTTTMKPTFATGAMLFTFVTLGKFMEAFAKGKTASALQALMELQPQSALKVVGAVAEMDNKVDLSALETIDIDAADVRPGDYLYILPGSRIPADGILIASSESSNSTYVDESALSGEPFPVVKQMNENLFGATVNQLSTLLMKVTASGNATALAKIVQLMEQAQSQKAPIQAQADLIACIFAPMVLFLSFLTFFGWLIFNHGQDRYFLAIMSSISVIVVACPCALGLATPTAVMVGTGIGASHGLLIKGGAVLEGAHGINTVILDKTGTLTTGKAILKDCKHFIASDNDAICQHLPERIPPQQVALWLAACAEKQSEHPLAKAIVNAAKASWGGDVTCSQDGVEVSGFHISVGSGVECLVRKPHWGEWRVRVGNRMWVNESLVNMDTIITDCVGDAEVDEMRQTGKVCVYISVLSEHQFLEKVDPSGKSHSRRVIGVFGISDPIEREARSTVLALQKMGIEVWMCTGDNEATALAVAKQVGIEEANVCAGVKPEGKADLVTRLQKRRSRHGHGGRRYQNGCVAMVGDGINDAVALARANVGIALGAGTEVAVEAADMVLVRSSLHDVVVALHLSRVVFQRIRINFVWAMGYNMVALPFAAGALYPFLSWRLPPEFAGLMMAFSSVSVVTSSLLLRTYIKPVILEDGSFARSDCCGRLFDYPKSICDHYMTKLPVLRAEPRYDDIETDEEDRFVNEDRFEIV